MRKSLGLVLLLFLLGSPGVALLIIGIVKTFATARFLSSSPVPAQGQVVSLNLLRANQDDPDTYSAVIEYPVAGLSPQRFAIETDDTFAYRIGTKVDLLYVRTPLPEARLAGFHSLWVAPLTFMAAGIPWAGFAVFMGVAALRSRKPAVAAAADIEPFWPT